MENTKIQMSNYQRKALSSAAASLLSQNMSTMLLSFVLASIIADFSLSGAAGGAISTITNAGMLLGGLIFGPISDRYGRPKILALTIAIFSLATGLTAFSTNIFLVYLFRFFVGIGGGGEYGVIMSIIGDAFSTEKRGRVTSIVQISGQMGSIVAAVVAALIVPLFGWRGLFIFGTLPILLAIYVYIKLPESEVWKNSKDENDINKASISDLFKENRTANTIRLTIMAICQVAGYFGLMNWLPSILQQRAGLSVSNSSLWMIATIIGMSLGMWVFGNIMDKISAKTAYAIFLVASAISVFAYSYAQNATTILIGGIIVGFFANGMNAGYGAIVNNLYPSKIRATANNTIFNIGRAVGGFSSIVIGFLLDNYTLVIAMGFLSLLYLISLSQVLLLNENIE